MSEQNTSLIPLERIEQSIFIIRGQKVMLDSDLAELYGVSVSRLNQSVKRNTARFPMDFMFRLTEREVENLRSQFATSSSLSQFVIAKGRGGRQTPPYVFTEYGVAMLSSVLKSERALAVNIEIMRTFGKYRRILSTHKDLADQIKKLEKRYDKSFSMVFKALYQLMKEEEDPKKLPIGFNTK
jgi:hypothetical protein